MSKESKRESIKNNSEDFPGRNTIKVTRSIEGNVKRGIRIESNRLTNSSKSK